MTTHGSPKRPALWPGRYDQPAVPTFLPSASRWSKPFTFIAALKPTIGPECGIEYDSNALRDRMTKCVGLHHAPTAQSGLS